MLLSCYIKTFTTVIVIACINLIIVVFGSKSKIYFLDVIFLLWFYIFCHHSSHHFQVMIYKCIQMLFLVFCTIKLTIICRLVSYTIVIIKLFNWILLL